MAANTNKRWKESLDFLQCPYTVSLSSEEVGQLLLNETEERLDILEWLLVLYQPSFGEILESNSRKTGKVIKLRFERILKTVGSLCLCHPEDVNLIKGAAPVQKQRVFLNRLIDLVLCRESEQISSPRDAATYIDRLANQGLCLNIEEKIDLIPKDLRTEVDCSYSGLDGLRATQLECARQIEKLQDEISELRKKVEVKTPSSEKEVSAMTEMLSSSIQDLDQLATGFLHSYESHIGAWCQGAQPELNDIGPTAKRVHTQLRKIVPLLEDVDKLRQLRCDLEDDVKDHRTRKAVEAASTGINTSDNIQRCLGILEESIHRMESGFKSRYPPSLYL